MQLYPMTFEPVYHEKLWGGRRLETLFQRKLPSGRIGESWDVAAHPNGMSIVNRGSLQGSTLAQVAAEYPDELYGTSALVPERFPLLVKIIDAQQALSVQVHPDDAYGREHEQGEYGKTEAWYVLHAEPGATVVYGLHPDVTKESFRRLVESGRTEEGLREIPVQAGDILHIPAGLVHALGAGVVVAEVQQNSDTVYRVFDWNRVDDSGQPRELHVDKAFDVINFTMQPQPLKSLRNPVVANEHFIMEIYDNLDAATVSDANRFHILMCLSGKTHVAWQDHDLTLQAGDSCLVPAACQGYAVHSHGKLLRAYQPTP